MESNDAIAPFVMKTYQMVNDSSLDNLIRWGISNNSFIVLNSLDFSQRLLPAYFKHNNFSSFIRQLNTYGFRKVDPDRWEFANEWFLRGQVHLLKNIGRKRQTCGRRYSMSSKRFDLDNEEDDEDEKEMKIEIERLKQEQKILEQEVVTMNKRIEATERLPEQMMSLLCKVADDPKILDRMLLEQSKRLVEQKRQRRLITTQPPLPPTSSSSGYSNSVKSEFDEYYENIGEVEFSPQSAVEPVPVWLWDKDRNDGGSFPVDSEQNNWISRNGNNSGGGDTVYFGGGAMDPDGRSPAPPYPFSLLGGGF